MSTYDAYAANNGLFCQAPFLLTETNDSISRKSLLRVPLISTKCNIQIFNSLSITTIEHQFLNNSHCHLECQYRFPIKDSAAVYWFEAKIGNKLIKAKVFEKSESRQVYNAALGAGKIASILEEVIRDVFQVSIGNVPPYTLAVIRLSYVSEIEHDAQQNQIRFVLPTSVAPRYGYLPFDHLDMPVQKSDSSRLEIRVTVETFGGRAEWDSPSHREFVKEVGAVVDGNVDASGMDLKDMFGNGHVVRLAMNRPNQYLEKDFLLIIKAKGLDVPTCVIEPSLVLKSGKPESYAMMLTLTPHGEREEIKSELVFLIDRSESMEEGDNIERAKEALILFLHSLTDGCYFNIIGFGSRFIGLWEKSVAYSETTFHQALEYAENLRADLNGTEILKPLEHALKIRREDMPTQILLVTDGNAYVQNLEKKVEHYITNSNSFVRIFTLGIGNLISHDLLNTLSRVGKGYSSFVTDAEDMRAKVIEMYKNALTPPVVDYKISWPMVTIEKNTLKLDAEPEIKRSGRCEPYTANKTRFDSISNEYDMPKVIQAPNDVPGLYNGSRFLVCTLFNGNIDSIPPEVTVTGMQGSKPITFKVPVTVTRPGKVIHTITVRKIIQDLEDGRSYLHLNDTLVVSESIEEKHIVYFGKKYSLASKFTSFVAFDYDIPTYSNWKSSSHAAQNPANSYSEIIKRKSGVQIRTSIHSLRRTKNSSSHDTDSLDLNFAKVGSPKSYFAEDFSSDTASSGSRSSIFGTRKKKSRASNYSGFWSWHGPWDRSVHAIEERRSHREFGARVTSPLPELVSKGGVVKKVDEFHLLIKSKNYNGSFYLSDLRFDHESRRQILALISEKGEEISKKFAKDYFEHVWGTIVAIVILRVKFRERRTEWEFVERRARGYLYEMLNLKYEGIEDLIWLWTAELDGLIKK